MNVSTLRRLEGLVLSLRHSRGLRSADWLWDRARPHYDRLIETLAPAGLERVLNGSDRIRLLPVLRQQGPSYEPDVWQALMREVRVGDVVADIGAFVGLYTVAVAQRVGPEGRVVAFEPDPANFALLRAQVALNRLEDRIELVQAAVSEVDGQGGFAAGRGLESRLATADTPEVKLVELRRLDTVFAERRLDLLKIDVEGFEEAVIRGGSGLLADPARRPRAIFIEVHPYAWSAIGSSSAGLISLLERSGYELEDLAGRPVSQIKDWGEVIARRCR
jgi:FkbM family methyltransferase